MAKVENLTIPAAPDGEASLATRLQEHTLDSANGSLIGITAVAPVNKGISLDTSN